MSRVLKTGDNQVTCTYAQHCANVAAGKAWAKGVDVVKHKSQIDKITAHSAGRVLRTVDYLSGTNGIIDKAGMGYGNYVMLLHENNYVTLYAHLEAVYVREGQTVVQGDEIGLMGNTGNSFGAHLHFEVRKYKATPSGNLHDVNAYEWLDAGEWLDKEFPRAVVSVEVKAGAKFDLRDTPIYNSESGKSYGRRSGTYYVWSEEVRNGRVRMTNSSARVGVNKQVSFWVALADIGATAEVKAESSAETIPVAGNTFFSLFSLVNTLIILKNKKNMFIERKIKRRMNSFVFEEFTINSEIMNSNTPGKTNNIFIAMTIKPYALLEFSIESASICKIHFMHLS